MSSKVLFPTTINTQSTNFRIAHSFSDEDKASFIRGISNKLSTVFEQEMRVTSQDSIRDGLFSVSYQALDPIEDSGRLASAVASYVERWDTSNLILYAFLLEGFEETELRRLGRVNLWFRGIKDGIVTGGFSNFCFALGLESEKAELIQRGAFLRIRKNCMRLIFVMPEQLEVSPSLLTEEFRQVLTAAVLL